MLKDILIKSKIRNLEVSIAQISKDFNSLTEAIMLDPKFVEVDLTDLVLNGVMMAANEQFFWPLGLALTWTKDDEAMTELHIRQWDYGDPDYHETITLQVNDQIGPARRVQFQEWINARIQTLPEDERQGARQILGRLLVKPGALEVT